MIKLESLNVVRGGQLVLRDLSLELAAEEITVLIGPSGCGKTTLLSALAGWVTVESGRVVPRLAMSEVGVLFQDYQLFPWHTVEKNLRLACGSAGVGSRAEREELVSEIAGLLGVSELLGQYPHELSGGQRQRVALGQLLAKRPKWLLLDEPTSALDAFTKEKIQDLLVRVQREFQVSLVVVSHSIEEAAFLGRQVVVMRDGCVVDQIENLSSGSTGYRQERAFFEQQLRLRRALEGTV